MPERGALGLDEWSLVVQFGRAFTGRHFEGNVQLVDAFPLVIRFGAAVGILMIVQAALWIDALGITNEVIVPMLWRAIVREVGPLLACLVVIGRSGVAISTELATMVVSGEVDVEKGGQLRDTTVFFSDIRGFTAMSETRS